MTTLTTMSEKEILEIAWEYKLRKWIKELDKNEQSIKERGKENSIALHCADIYKTQLDELSAAIIAIEKAE